MTITRIRVVAGSVVTWLVVAAMICTIVAAELADMIGADHVVVVLILRVVAWLAVATSIVRRVTPVLDDARGILPVPDVPVTSREAWLESELEHARSLHP